MAATDDVKRYFARAWEDTRLPPPSAPWRHDYIKNVTAFMAGYCFMAIVTSLYFGAFEYMLLRNFPAAAQRWCFVQGGQTRTALQRRRWSTISVGVNGAFVTRFVFEPLLSSSRGPWRRHWWSHEIGSCVGMTLTLTVVLGLVLLTVAVCWVGDTMKQKTGWVSAGQCRLRGHCSVGSCACAQYGRGEARHQKTFESGGQPSRLSVVASAPGEVPEETHCLPPYGPGGVRMYGVRDHYSKHPHNPAMLGLACHTPYQQRPGYTEYIKSLIESPVAEVRKLFSPLPDHVSIRHGANGTEAYHTITAQPPHQGESQEELRFKYYRESHQEQAGSHTDVVNVREDATDDPGTTWLRARQFASSIFSDSTSTALSHDSFGRSSMGRRGPLVDIEDGGNREGMTSSVQKDSLCKTHA